MKLKLNVYAYLQSWDMKWSYFATTFDSADKENVKIQELEIEVPDGDDRALRLALAVQLREGKKDIQARCEVQLQELDTRIRELLALEDLSGQPR